MTTISKRLKVAIEVIKRFGKFRALEAGSPNIPPTPNPLGEGFTGVDLDGATFRARIGVTDALNGAQNGLYWVGVVVLMKRLICIVLLM